MKIELSGGLVWIDLTTKRWGVSAGNQFVDDPNTEVYYGSLHASVTFLDAGVVITMDPHEGNWKDARWSRRRAWERLLGAVGPADMFLIVQAALERGKHIGADEARTEIRNALGVS